MVSINFPDMFNSVYTNVTEDITSDINNIDLFFNSKKGELFGDPHFGTLIHSFLFHLKCYPNICHIIQ